MTAGSPAILKGISHSGTMTTSRTVETILKYMLLSLSIRVRIAGKGIGAGQRLGSHRLVVVRPPACPNCFRRLTVRYERRADIHHVFLILGCALLYFTALHNGL